MAQQTAASLWTRILAIVASSLGAVVIAVGGYVIDSAIQRIDNLAGLAAGLAVSVAENSIKTGANAREIESAVTSQEKTRQVISNFMVDASARPDPFTGTEGRELRKLIDAIERRLDSTERGVSSMAALTDRVRLMEKNQREYQASIIPLIQQSNMLQMQRINKGINANGP